MVWPPPVELLPLLLAAGSQTVSLSRGEMTHHVTLAEALEMTSEPWVDSCCLC